MIVMMTEAAMGGVLYSTIQIDLERRLYFHTNEGSSQPLTPIQRGGAISSAYGPSHLMYPPFYF